MAWILLALKRSTDFQGRSRRREYWWFTAASSVVFIFATILDFAFGTIKMDVGVGVFGGLALLLGALPFLAVSVRRLHDIGWSGWWVVLCLTGVGSLVLTVGALLNSRPGDNEYGPNPKTQGSPYEQRLPAAGSAKRRVLTGVAIASVAVATLWFAGSHFMTNTVEGVRAEGAKYELAGQTAGLSSDEQGCLEAGLERVKALPEKTMLAVVLQGRELASCMKASRYVGSFCDGVPAEKELIGSGLWSARACAAHGLSSEHYCVTLMQTVMSYCNSPAHRSKVVGQRPETT